MRWRKLCEDLDPGFVNTALPKCSPEKCKVKTGRGDEGLGTGGQRTGPDRLCSDSDSQTGQSSNDRVAHSSTCFLL